MSTAEYEKITQMIGAMNSEEQNAIIKCPPTEMLYEELGLRLANQIEFINRIITTVQESV